MDRLLPFFLRAPLRTIRRLVPRRECPVTYTYKLSRRLASGHETIRIFRPLVLLALLLLATACGSVPR